MPALAVRGTTERNPYALYQAGFAFLLVLWPLYVLGATMQSRVEDGLLESTFGEEYRRYATRVGRFLPRLA